MPNDYFQFKQFTIQQAKTGMKVSTDACIQGAFAAQFWQNKSIENILDIGSGTGLLSLMLAQKIVHANIVGIEMEQAAFEQSTANFQTSTWAQRLCAHHSKLQDFHSTVLFDAIICNPPFFHNHLKSNLQNRNDARHDQALSKSDLAKSVYQLLNKSGIFCVLYPTTEWEAWQLTASENELYLQHYIAIQPSKNKAANRILSFWTKEKVAAPTISVFTIYEDQGKTYTPEFIVIMQDYYLHL